MSTDKVSKAEMIARLNSGWFEYAKREVRDYQVREKYGLNKTVEEMKSYCAFSKSEQWKRIRQEGAVLFIAVIID